jgi:bifunctional non-homologous end joining protein LigD
MAKRRFGRYTVETSNEDKVLFPGAGITKGDLIDYYVDIADTMLPHLADRALSMQRFPDGIDEAGFYEKKLPDYFPDWIDRVRVSTSHGAQQQVVCSNAATLAYLGQLACVTPHVWLSRRDRLDVPDRLVFDLDPPGDDFEPVREAAFLVREALDAIGLASYAMTTGSRGVHVVVPLARRDGFDDVRAFSQRFAKRLAANHEDRLTVAQKKKDRGNRVYLDTSNNAYGQTTVAPYAVRARDGAPVATPLDWDELGDAKTHARRWTLKSIPRRLAQREDPWQGLAGKGVSLTRARNRLDDLDDDT